MRGDEKSFVLKILLVSQVYYFYIHNLKVGLVFIGFAFSLLVFKKFSSELDYQLEKIAKLIGSLVLKVFLFIIFVFVILPSRIFYKVSKGTDSNFVQVAPDKIVNYRKPW